MAKRRMISQELIIDEEFNSLSIEAQNLFVRMLVVSDDYGVVPANRYALCKLINPPAKIVRQIQKYLEEIGGRELGSIVEYGGRSFFIFKPEAFERYQSYILNKRTKSEYLRLSAEVLDSGKFQEILGNSCSAKVERSKYKDVSKEQKDKKDKPKDLAEVKECFITKRYANSSLEAEKFFNFYESKGWRVGRDLMRDWKRAAANWNIRNLEKCGAPNKEPLKRDPPTPEELTRHHLINCTICGKTHDGREVCEN